MPLLGATSRRRLNDSMCISPTKAKAVDRSTLLNSTRPGLKLLGYLQKVLVVHQTTRAPHITAYLYLLGFEFETGLYLFEVWDRRDETSFHHHDNLDQAGKSAGTFRVADVGFYRADV